MSSILFDPATATGQGAGARPAPNAGGILPGNVSFDALLAKTQSRHDADANYGSERFESDRGYDTARDYENDQIDYEDSDYDSDLGADRDDTQATEREDRDSYAEEPAEREAEQQASDSDEHERSGDGSDVAAVEGRSQSDAAAEQTGEDGIAAAGGAQAAAQDRSGAAAAAAQAASSSRRTAQAAQAPNATANNQQAANQAAADGKQPGSASASVVNNSLLSQSNTALTSGTAVIALQSVDPKSGEAAGRLPAFDPLAEAEVTDGPDIAAVANKGKTAAQLAKLRQGEGTGPQAVAQTAGNGANNAQAAVAAAAQQAASPAAAAMGGEAAGAAVTSTTAAGTGTPSFTSLAPVGGVTQTANATGAGAAASGNAAAATATPSEQVAVEIHKGIAAGKDSITIRLNPAELGKIDVKMELSDDGSLRAMIAVDKPETLDLLQKDIRGLERALQNAGLQADSGSLNFSLRGDGDNQPGGFETASGSGGSNNGPGEEGSAEDPLAGNGQTNRSSHDGAVDISV